MNAGYIFFLYPQSKSKYLFISFFCKDVAQVNNLLRMIEHPHIVRHQSFEGNSNVFLKGL